MLKAAARNGWIDEPRAMLGVADGDPPRRRRHHHHLLRARRRARDRVKMPKPIPEGWHSVTPGSWFTTPPGWSAFLKQAFGATWRLPHRLSSPDQNWRLARRGSAAWAPATRCAAFSLSLRRGHRRDGTSERWQPAPVSLEEPQDMPYGDRRGMVKDPCDNVGKSPPTRRTSRWTTSAGAPPPSPSRSTNDHAQSESGGRWASKANQTSPFGAASPAPI